MVVSKGGQALANFYFLLTYVGCALMFVIAAAAAFRGQWGAAAASLMFGVAFTVLTFLTTRWSRRRFEKYK